MALVFYLCTHTLFLWVMLAVLAGNKDIILRDLSLGNAGKKTVNADLRSWVINNAAGLWDPVGDRRYDFIFRLPSQII